MAFSADTNSRIHSQQAVIRASPIDRRQYFHRPNSQRNLINKRTIHLEPCVRPPAIATTTTTTNDQLHCLRLFIAKLHQRNLSMKQAKIYLCVALNSDGDAHEMRSWFFVGFSEPIAFLSPIFRHPSSRFANCHLVCRNLPCRCECVEKRWVYHYQFITIIIYIKRNCCDSDTERFSDRLNRLHESKTRFATATKKSEDKVSFILFSSSPSSVFFVFFSSGIRHHAPKKNVQRQSSDGMGLVFGATDSMRAITNGIRVARAFLLLRDEYLTCRRIHALRTYARNS